MANTGYRSLLDCWTPPQMQANAVDATKYIPKSFISTTFTFDAEFFDDECLTRFLVMETERENDGVAFLIEREEKLAGLQAGIVLVDQVNCRGERSLRWDLVPCRVKKGIMHSKITILHWSNCIRLIIGSGNLTETGCCLNQEVFSVIDYVPEGEADLLLITGALAQLKMIIDEQCGDIVKNRFNLLQAEIKSTLRRWGILENGYGKDDLAVHFLPVSPKESNTLTRLREIFNKYSASPPDTIYITSPFFDKDEKPYSPSIKITEELRKKGAAHLYYNVTTEPLSDSGKIVVNAPDFLKHTSRPELSVSFEKVNEIGLNEDGKEKPRPLHMKSIWLCNEDVHCYMIGSSNFTSAGLGLGNFINYEANVVYVVSKSRNRKAYNLLFESCIKSTELNITELEFHSRPNEDEKTAEDGIILLPACFGEAIIKKTVEQFILELNFNNDKVPEGFKIHNNTKDAEDSLYYIFNEEQWKLNKGSLKINLDWTHEKMPDYLLVTWKGLTGEAFWPVIVENQITLPPLECLRNLPLEALLQILSSNQPLHRLLGKIEMLKRNQSQGIDEVVDPHKLVNTSRFLLQRTRRVAYGMKSLRERLEKPVFTKESLIWRIYGPIGVNALVQAIKKEAHSEDEKKFLLAELALELSRVVPKKTEFSLKSSEIKAALKSVMEQLKIEVMTETDHINLSISSYSKNAIQKAIHAL